MRSVIITRLAAVAAAGATALVLAGPAQASTAASHSVTGKEWFSGVAFGKNAISSHTTYPLVLRGLVRTRSLFTPPSGNKAVIPTPKGRLGVRLVPPMRAKLVSLDRHNCYGVEEFTAGVDVVTGTSSGVFAGASGQGHVALMFGAFLPRRSNGACNLRGNPVSPKDAFSSLNARLELTLRK